MLKWRMPCNFIFHILVELRKGVEFYEILGMLKSITWELMFHKKGPCAIICACWLLNLWKCKLYRLDIFTRWCHRYTCHNTDARCTLEFIFQQPPLNISFWQFPFTCVECVGAIKGSKVCNLQSLGCCVEFYASYEIHLCMLIWKTY